MSRFIRYFSEELLLLLIIFLAAVFRLILYGSFSYSNDELSAIIRASYPSFQELVDKGFYVDGHPGGIQVLIFYWMKMFGNSPAALRLPFVIMGIFAVWMSYILSKRWFNKATGIYVMSFVAFLQFPVLFSQIARPYGPGLLFSLLMTYTWTLLLFPLKEEKRTKRIFKVFLYGVSFALCMYTHYFCFLLGIILAGIGLFYLSKINRYYYFASLLIASLLFSPHIRITLNHLSIKGVGEWLAKPDSYWLWNHVRYIFNTSAFTLTITLLVSVLTIILNRKNLKFNKFHLFATILFLAPFLIGFVYSVFINPVLQNSVLIFSFPFLIILLFSFANPGFNRINTVLVIFLNLSLITDLLFISNYYNKQHFGEFKDVAKTIESWNRRIGIDNVNEVIVVNNPWYIHYYLDKLNFSGKFLQYDNKGGKDLLELNNIISSSNTPYFIYAWTKPAPDEITDLILAEYPYIIESKDYDGLSQVTLFGKKCFTGLCAKTEPVFLTENTFDNPEMIDVDPGMISSLHSVSPPNSILLNDKFEYGPSFKSSISDVVNGEFSTIKISCSAFSKNDTCDTKLVATVESQSGTTIAWAASDFENYVRKNCWSKVYFTFRLPKEIKKTDIIKIYPWNHGLKDVFIDNLTIRFYK